MGEVLGLLQETPDIWFGKLRRITVDSSMPVETLGSNNTGKMARISEDAIDQLIGARNLAKKAKNWAEADRIRNELKSQGILLEDRPGGTTDWRRA